MIIDHELENIIKTAKSIIDNLSKSENMYITKYLEHLNGRIKKLNDENIAMRKTFGEIVKFGRQPSIHDVIG